MHLIVMSNIPKIYSNAQLVETRSRIWQEEEMKHLLKGIFSVTVGAYPSLHLCIFAKMYFSMRGTAGYR